VHTDARRRDQRWNMRARISPRPTPAASVVIVASGCSRV
jgi:hypothetical protein